MGQSANGQSDRNNNELAVMSMIGFSIKKDKDKDKNKKPGGIKEHKMKVMEELDTQSHLKSHKN